VLAEFDRLEALLSAYRPDSEWSRWRASAIDEAGPELRTLLRLAATWHARSAGAFNPAVGVLRARWRRAVDEQREPGADELARLAASIVDLPYRVHSDGRVERTGDCTHLDLHAIAKGWIVDRAAEQATTMTGVQQVVVNAGGDLLHRGAGELIGRVEDPREPYDNAPPMVLVRVVDAALATSSPSRRGLRVGEQVHHHVIDPRTGHPARHVWSASVLAPDCATADALATVVGVLPIADGLAATEATHGAACCLLDEHGEMWRSHAWDAAEQR
jgi:thiamine biosynthesis lipoprotein